MAPKRQPAASTSAPAPDPLPSSFSTAQAKKAVDALLAYNSKVLAERDELLPREEHVYLVLNTKRGTTHKKIKSITMYVKP
jgi:ribosome biogenesis protein UTP30